MPQLYQEGREAKSMIFATFEALSKTQEKFGKKLTIPEGKHICHAEVSNNGCLTCR
jgi:hypothetical protein